MNCDMCGSNQSLVKALIEGTELIVCQNCAKFGKTLAPVQQEIPKQKPKKPIQVQEEPEIIETITSDFSQILKKKRESLGLKQEDFAKKINEKLSFVHKLENGELTPSIEKAKKFEKLLNIKLIEEYKDEHIKTAKSSSTEVTIGDIIKIKK